MKNNPKYVRSLQKSHLLDHFFMNLIPYSRYTRTVLNCEKIPFYVNFWTSLIPPWHSSGPCGIHIPICSILGKILSKIIHFSKISLNLSQFWLKFGNILKNRPIHIPNFAFHKRTFIYMYQQADFATHVGGWLLYRVLPQFKTWDLVSTSLPSVFISFKLKW